MYLHNVGYNGFTSIKTRLLHCFVYTLVRIRPRKWIEDNTCPNAGAIFLFWMKTQPNAGAWQTLETHYRGGGGGGGDPDPLTNTSHLLVYKYE